MKLAVSITTMNRPATFLATFRAAVALSAPDVETDLTVVDNGSVDLVALEQLDVLENAGVRVIRNATNLGLSRAVNQGLAAGAEAGADVLIHLDDDGLVRTQDWDRVLASYFAHPVVGLVVTNPAGVGIPKGGAQTTRVGEEAFAALGGSEASPGPALGGSRSLSDATFRGPGYPPTGPPYREVSWGLGFCWAIRRSLYDEISGYDCQLAHQNEVDLAIRVRLAGYEVAGIDTVDVLHNDPSTGAPKSAVAAAREHIGCVQLRDKYAMWALGVTAGYGRMPLTLAPHHLPIEQDFLRRYAEHHGVDLNPPPGVLPALGPGAAIGLTPETIATIENGAQLLQVGGAWFLIRRTIGPDFSHWERGDGYMKDRQKAIDAWEAATGERYVQYQWPSGYLKPRENS